MKINLAVLVLLSLAITSPGAAGDGESIPIVVNMTPDGSDAAARECATVLRRGLRSDVGRFLTKGESVMRASIVRAGDPRAATRDFFEWEDDALDLVATDLYEEGGALLFFDCRPTERVFRALIVPQGPGNVRVQLRGPLMNAERALDAIKTLVDYRGVGWVP